MLVRCPARSLTHIDRSRSKQVVARTRCILVTSQETMHAGDIIAQPCTVFLLLCVRSGSELPLPTEQRIRLLRLSWRSHREGFGGGSSDLRSCKPAHSKPDLVHFSFFQVLTDAFTEQREVPEYRDRDLNYEALCEVMQGVSHKSESFRTGALQLAERYVVLYDQLRDPIYNHSFSQVPWISHCVQSSLLVMPQLYLSM